MISIMCAVSGIAMDVRVLTLIERAGTGEIPHAALERADQIATLLLLFTLAINCACAVVVIAWGMRASIPTRVRLFACLAALAVPLGNPAAAFLVRGYSDGLWFAIVAKGLAIAAAVSIGVLIKRYPRPADRIPP